MGGGRSEGAKKLCRPYRASAFLLSKDPAYASVSWAEVFRPVGADQMQNLLRQGMAPAERGPTEFLVTITFTAKSKCKLGRARSPGGPLGQRPLPSFNL